MSDAREMSPYERLTLEERTHHPRISDEWSVSSDEEGEEVVRDEVEAVAGGGEDVEAPPEAGVGVPAVPTWAKAEAKVEAEVEAGTGATTSEPTTPRLHQEASRGLWGHKTKERVADVKIRYATAEKSRSHGFGDGGLGTQRRRGRTFDACGRCQG